MAKEFEQILTQCVSNLRLRLPMVTGNMRRNTIGYRIGNINENSQGIIGKISIEVPYAQFVNYGFEKHPNSKKLRKDYQIVETTLKRTLNTILARKGGHVI